MPARTVHISETGMRLDRFLRIHFGGVRLGRGGAGLTVDGAPVAPGLVLRAGQVVAVTDRPAVRAAGPDAAVLSAEDRAFLSAITLFQDEDLLVFNKPSGLAVHPGTRITRDLDTLIAGLATEGGERPVLAHRLDKDTSGLIVAARSKAVAAVLGKAFAGRDVTKTYRAVVEGAPDLSRGRARDGVIDIPIAKQATPRGGRMVEMAPGDPEAQTARTRIEVHSRLAAGTVVELSPETGRQHQLRVHLALIGHPILGDALYGDVTTAPRLMLHAHRLRLRHPRRGWIELEAPLPEGFGDAT